MDILAEIFNVHRLAGLGVALTLSLAWDLYWGYVWWVFFLDRPIYRADEPDLFWKCEIGQAVVALFLYMPAIIKLLGWLG